MKSVGGTLVLKNPTAVKALSWSKKYVVIRRQVGWGSERKWVVSAYPVTWRTQTRTWYDTHITTVLTPKVPSNTLRKLAHKIEGKILSIEETKIFLSEEKREERILVSY